MGRNGVDMSREEEAAAVYGWPNTQGPDSQIGRDTDLVDLWALALKGELVRSGLLGNSRPDGRIRGM